MASKSNTEVIIGGKVYTLSGYEGEEYLQRVAVYINNKINEFNEMEEVRRFTVDMKATLIQLNIADDYFKAKDRIEKLEQDLELKEKEIYDLKHELISAQIQSEANEKTSRELELQNKELLLKKTQLEAALEDALLGPIEKEQPQTQEENLVLDTSSLEGMLDDVLAEPPFETAPAKPSGSKNKKGKK